MVHFWKQPRAPLSIVVQISYLTRQLYTCQGISVLTVYVSHDPVRISGEEFLQTLFTHFFISRADNSSGLHHMCTFGLGVWELCPEESVSYTFFSVYFLSSCHMLLPRGLLKTTKSLNSFENKIRVNRVKTEIHLPYSSEGGDEEG
jgi:hypothetical protein